MSNFVAVVFIFTTSCLLSRVKAEVSGKHFYLIFKKYTSLISSL